MKGHLLRLCLGLALAGVPNKLIMKYRTAEMKLDWT